MRGIHDEKAERVTRMQSEGLEKEALLGGDVMMPSIHAALHKNGANFPSLQMLETVIDRYVSG